MHEVMCRAFGPPQVTIDDVPAPAPLHWRKNLALLIYLLASPRRTRSREHLVGLLWPDRPDANARHSLNEALGTLRRAAGDGAVETPGDLVCLGDAFQSDMEQFARAMAAGEWGRAASFVAGEFAEGLVVPGASNFTEWLETERRHWQAQGIDALTRHAAALFAEGRVQAGVEAGRRALELDPRSDRAARALMRGLLLLGDAAGARELGERFAARLARDLGSRPEARTLDLVAQAATQPSGHAGWVRPLPEPLVGRERELSAAVAAWDRSRRERLGTLVLVLGEPGFGVSRLLHELGRRARLKGASVARVAAVDADRSMPLGGVIGLAEGGLLDAPGIAAVPSACIASLAARSARWVERFPATTPGGEIPVDVALGEVVAASAEERPVLLLLDDAHRLDDETLRTLPGLLRRWEALPVTLVLGASPAEPRPALDELRARLGRDHAGVAVSLGPLTVRALRELAAHLMPDYGVADLDRVVRRIVAGSGGIPLLALELLRAIGRGLELAPQTRPWPESFRTLDDSLPGELPDNLVAAVRINFRRLSPPARELLVAATVLPERFDAAGLARVTGRTTSDVEAALDELEASGWVSAEGRGYSFVARLMRRLVGEEMLTLGQRQRLLERLQGRR